MISLTRHVGIDIGTTVIRVYIKGVGIVAQQPSCIAFDRFTKDIIAVGEEARQMFGRENDSTEVVYPICGLSIASYKHAQALVASIVNPLIGGFSFIKPDVMLAVHPGATSVQRYMLEECLLNVGFRAVYSEPLPILAALGANIPFHDAHGRVIVDIGARTLNAAVVSAGGIVSAKTVSIGGAAIDEAIVSMLEETRGVKIGIQTAEHIKMTVGSAILVKKERMIEVEGLALETDLPEIVTTSTNEVVRVIQPVLKQFEKAIGTALSTIPPQMASDILDHGVVLCGGASRLHFLPHYLKAQLGINMFVASEADKCVIRGAGALLRGVDIHKKELLVKR